MRKRPSNRVCGTKVGEAGEKVEYSRKRFLGTCRLKVLVRPDSSSKFREREAIDKGSATDEQRDLVAKHKERNQRNRDTARAWRENNVNEFLSLLPVVCIEADGLHPAQAI